MQITEVMGLEGDTIILQDVLKYEMEGEDEDSKKDEEQERRR